MVSKIICSAQSGRSVYQLSREFGVSRYFVEKATRNAGVICQKGNTYRKPPRPPRRRDFTPEQVVRAFELFVSGRNYPQILAELGKDPEVIGTVRGILARKTYRDVPVSPELVTKTHEILQNRKTSLVA